MTTTTPTWLQAGTYPAGLDRDFLAELIGVQSRQMRAMRPLSNFPTDLNIRVSLGEAFIAGSDETDQGVYFMLSDGAETVATPAPPVSGTRIDVVIGRVRDPDAGGDAGDDVVFEVIEGGTAIPDSAIVLGEVYRYAGETTIEGPAVLYTGMQRGGRWPVEAQTGPPDSYFFHYPANSDLVEGSMFVQVA